MRWNIEQGRYVEAFHIFDSAINGDLINTTSYFYNVTGINDSYNYLLTNDPEDENYYISFITRADRRKQIHVGNMSYIDVNVLVEKILINDLVRDDYCASLNILEFSRCKVWLGKSQPLLMLIIVF